MIITAHTFIKSLCCMPETNTILYVKHISIKWGKWVRRGWYHVSSVPSGLDCFFSAWLTEPQICFLYSRACQRPSLLVFMGQNGHFKKRWSVLNSYLMAFYPSQGQGPNKLLGSHPWAPLLTLLQLRLLGYSHRAMPSNHPGPPTSLLIIHSALVSHH